MSSSLKAAKTSCGRAASSCIHIEEHPVRRFRVWHRCARKPTPELQQSKWSCSWVVPATQCAATQCVDPRQSAHACQVAVSDSEGPDRYQSSRERNCQAQLTRQIKRCSCTQELLAVLKQHANDQQLNHIHVTALATRFAHLLHETPPVSISELTAPPSSQNNGFSSLQQLPQQHRCSMAVAIQLLRELLEALQQHTPNLDARGLANVLWALASTARSLHLSIRTDVDSPSSSTGAILLNGSYSDLQQQLCTVSGKLIAAAGEQCWQQFNTQHISNTLWAAAVLNLHLSQQQIQAALAAATHRSLEFTAQGYSSLLWACAHLGIDPGIELVNRAPDVLVTAEPQAISNTLWAVAQLGIQPHIRWTARLLYRCQPNLTHFGHQSLANTAWALAQLKYCPASGFLQAFLQESSRQLPSMQLHHVSMLLWGLSQIMPEHSKHGWSRSTRQHAKTSCHIDYSQFWATSATQMLQVLPHMSGKQFAVTSYALSSSGWQPTSDLWLEAWCDAFQHHMLDKSMSAHSLASCIAAGAVWNSGASVDHTCHLATQLTGCLDAACGQLVSKCHVQITNSQQPVSAVGDADINASLSHDTVVLPLVTALTGLASLHHTHVDGHPTSLSPGTHELLQLADHVLPYTQTPHAARLAWALAKLGYVPDQAQLLNNMPALLQRFSQSIEGSQCSNAQVTPQEVAMWMWACQTWGLHEELLPFLQVTAEQYMSPLLDGRAPIQQDSHVGGKPSTHSAGMLAVVCLRSLAAIWHKPAVHVVSDTADDGIPAQQLHRLASTFLHVASQQCQTLTTRDLSIFLHSAVTLGFIPGKVWRQRVGRQAVQLAMTGQLGNDLPLVMWCLARLRLVPTAQAASHMLHIGLHGHPTQQQQHRAGQHALEASRICSMLTACKLWHMQPCGEWWDAFFSLPGWAGCLPAALPGQQQLHQPNTVAAKPLASQPQDTRVQIQNGIPHSSAVHDSRQPGWSLTDVHCLLRLLVSLQVTPPLQWLVPVRQFATASLHTAQRVTVKGRSVLPHTAVHCFALAMQLVTQQEYQQMWLVRSNNSSSNMTKHDQEDCWPIKALRMAEQQLPVMSLGSATTILLACARSSQAPMLTTSMEEFLTIFLIVSQPLLSSAIPSQLLRLLRAIALLKGRPGPDWSEAMHSALRGQLHSMSRDQLFAVLPALVAARCPPSRTWLLQYIELVTACITTSNTSQAHSEGSREPPFQPSIQINGYTSEIAGSNSIEHHQQMQLSRVQPSSGNSASKPTITIQPAQMVLQPPTTPVQKMHEKPVRHTAAIALQSDTPVPAEQVSALYAALLRIDKELALHWRKSFRVEYS